MAVLKYKNPDTNIWEKLSGFIQLGTDVPVGAICEYAGETIPEDYLQCDGSSLLRTDYPDLFNAIGTTHGSVDSLHFNLPNIKSRTVVGLNSDDSDFNTLGKIGGNKTSTEINCGDNTYGLSTAPNLGYTDRSLIRKTAISSTHGEIDAQISLLQPYITLYYIIKAKTNTYSISKVIDNLDSDSSTDSLSANQGRVLNNKIDNLTTVYTGTNITAPTCEGFGKIRKIYGYSIQKTRDGKNKFSLSYIRSSSVFEVTETGVNLKNCWTADIYTHDDLLKVMKPSTTYTMRSKAKVISRPSTMIAHQYATMLLYRPGSSSLGSVVTPVLQMEDKETIALNTEKEYITTFTTPADLTDVRFLAYSFYGNNDGSTTGSAQGEIDLTEVMLVEGTYTTETFPDYEPYGVSPSPDYPSKIKNVGDNINIFNKNATPTVNKVTYTNDEDSITLTGTGGNWENAMYNIDTVVNQDYVFKCNFINSEASTVGVVIRDKDNNVLSRSSYISDVNGTFELTFSPVTTISKVQLFSNCSADVNSKTVTFSNIKVEKGLYPTEYSPYGFGSINIKTHSGNYFDLSKYIGIPCVLNGTATVTNTEITIKASSNNVTYTTIGLGNTGSVIAEAYRQYCMEIPEGANKLIVNFKNNNTVKLASIYYNVLDENYTVLSGIPRIYNSTDEEGILQADINVNNAKYVLVRFDATTGGDVTYKNILLGKTDSYVPYGEQNKIINIIKPLCGLKDDNGNIIAQDYIDFNKQETIRQCGRLIFNGTEDWIKHNFTYDGFTRFQIREENTKIWGKSICSHFIDTNGIPAMNACTIAQADHLILLCIDSTIATTVEQLKTWLASNNVVFEYELDSENIEQYIVDSSLRQYQDLTIISNSYNANMEVELTENKSISSINESVGALQRIASLATH